MTEDKNSWFDDPEWEKLRNEIRNHPVIAKSKKTQSTASSKVNDTKPKKVKLTLDLTLPNVKLPKATNLPIFKKAMAKVRSLKSRPKLVVIASAASLTIIAVILVGSNTLINKEKLDKPRSEEVLSQSVKEPEFATILPEGSKDQTNDGKIGYDEQKEVASFRDKIGIVEIVVSQQPLPEKFKSDPETELLKLAESFSAKEVIVPSNPKAYLGTSAKGPQTVIFYRNDLLVFIQSASKIDKDDWTDYIRSLR